MQNQHILSLEGAAPASKTAVHVLPPQSSPQRDVFEEAMLEHTSAHQHRNPFDWALAVGIHFAILAMLLILPLYFTAGLDFHRLNLTFLAPPMMPAAPPPPPMASKIVRPARIQLFLIFGGEFAFATSLALREVRNCQISDCTRPYLQASRATPAYRNRMAASGEGTC